MAQVLCTRENASTLINDVKFTQTDTGMLSEDISDEVAANFLEIPGYELVGEKSLTDEKLPVTKKMDAEQEKLHAELTARAAAVGLEVNTRWNMKTFAAKVTDAEAEAADKAATEANKQAAGNTDTAA